MCLVMYIASTLYAVSDSNASYLREATLKPCHSGMLLAGEVVHGRTDNGPKDGV